MSFEKKFAALGKELDEAFEAAEETAGPAPKPTSKKKTASKKKAAAKKKGPGVDDVREALRRVIDEGGNDAATEILSEFDTKKVSGLEEDQFASVIEACETYLDDEGGDEDPTS